MQMAKLPVVSMLQVQQTDITRFKMLALRQSHTHDPFSERGLNPSDTAETATSD